MSTGKIDREDVPNVSDGSDEWRDVREDVLNRDDHACRFCGLTDDEHREKHGSGLHAHHIIPDADGGSDSMQNLITVCQSCHRTLEATHARAVTELDSGGIGEQRVRGLRREIHEIAGECEWIYESVIPQLDASPRIQGRKIDEDDLRIPTPEETPQVKKYTDMEKSMFLLGLIEGLSRAGTHLEGILEGESADWGSVDFDVQYHAPAYAFWAPDDHTPPAFNNEEFGVW